jgi:hypothetical protein
MLKQKKHNNLDDEREIAGEDSIPLYLSYSLVNWEEPESKNTISIIKQ